MAPGSKSRLAILRTSTIFIRVASILTHFEVVQPKVRVRWFIASRREKGLGRPAVPPRTGIRRWQWSPIVKHSIFRISFACHDMQMSGSCGKSLPATTLTLRIPPGNGSSQAKSEAFRRLLLRWGSARRSGGTKAALVVAHSACGLRGRSGAPSHERPFRIGGRRAHA